MNALITFFISCIRKYNVWFLGILIVLQGIGVPTCPSLLVVAMGAFSFGGAFNPFILYFQVWILVTLGDGISYWIWRLFQEFLFKKFPILNKKFSSKLEKTQKYLDKNGIMAIFLSRFVVSAMAPVVNVVSGMSKYNFKIFILVAALGDLFWTALYEGIGYWFGDSWEQAASLVTELSKFLTLIVILIIAIVFLKKWISNKKK